MNLLLDNVSEYELRLDIKLVREDETDSRDSFCSSVKEESVSIAFNWLSDSSASSIDCSTTVLTVSGVVVVGAEVVVGAAVVSVAAVVAGAFVVGEAVVVGPNSSTF